MTRDEFRRTCRRVGALRRWPEAILLGVCAALSLRLGVSAWWLRAGVILAFFWAPLTTVLLYLLAAVLLARNPGWRWPA